MTRLPPLTDSARNALQKAALLLAEGFSGEIVLHCQDGGVHSVKAGRVWKADELRNEAA